MLENFEHRQDDIGAVSQHAQGFFGTTLEYTLSTRSTQSVHHIWGQAERDTLRHWQQFPLIKAALVRNGTLLQEDI